MPFKIAFGNLNHRCREHDVRGFLRSESRSGKNWLPDVSDIWVARRPPGFGFLTLNVRSMRDAEDFCDDYDALIWHKHTIKMGLSSRKDNDDDQQKGEGRGRGRSPNRREGNRRRARSDSRDLDPIDDRRRGDDSYRHGDRARPDDRMDARGRDRYRDEPSDYRRDDRRREERRHDDRRDDRRHVDRDIRHDDRRRDDDRGDRRRDDHRRYDDEYRRDEPRHDDRRGRGDRHHDDRRHDRRHDEDRDNRRDGERHRDRRDDIDEGRARSLSPPARKVPVVARDAGGRARSESSRVRLSSGSA